MRRARLDPPPRPSNAAGALPVLATASPAFAHDVNNLLTPVVGYASLLESALPASSAWVPMARQIQQSARRLVDLDPKDTIAQLRLITASVPASVSSRPRSMPSRLAR